MSNGSDYEDGSVVTTGDKAEMHGTVDVDEQQGVSTLQTTGANGRSHLTSKNKNKGKETKQKMDDVIFEMLEQLKTTSALQRKIDNLESGGENPNPRKEWNSYIGTEADQLPEHLWRQYQTESLALINRPKDAQQVHMVCCTMLKQN